MFEFAVDHTQLSLRIFLWMSYLCAASNDGSITDKCLLEEVVDLLGAFILVLEIEANFLCSVLHLSCC